MKVQITVDEQLWRKAKVSAMMRGQSLGELVGVALGDLLKNVLLSDGLGAFEKVLESPVKPVKEDLKQPKVNPELVDPVKVASSLVSQSKNSVLHTGSCCARCGGSISGGFKYGQKNEKLCLECAK